MNRVYVVMGVSGCGKSTVGAALAARLGCSFYDGDDYHPAANVAKMASGVPLEDGDRWPWLARLRELLAGHLAAGESAVVACSALKRSYREVLRGAGAGVVFVYLRGEYELIWSRMQQRAGHYMRPEMLRSQFVALEEPVGEAGVVWVDIGLGVGEIVTAVVDA